MNLQQKTRRSGNLLIITLLFLTGAAPGLTADTQEGILTTAAAVRNLSPAEAAEQRPVKLRGVVTFYDDALFSRFVQDETAGIYLLEQTNFPALSPGQVVELEGTTGPGEFAPVVLPTSIKVVGEAEIPAAKPVTLKELVSGQHDGQWVEFSGIVRDIQFDVASQYHVVDFAREGERFSVYVKQLPVAQAQDLVASTVNVRGVCATMFNHQRQLFGVRLLAPKADALVIERPAPKDPFDQPVRKIGSLLQFGSEGTLGGRVKVSGTVAFSTPGKAIFIQDEEAGLYCQTSQRDLLQPGDQVEVLGFPSRGDYTPMLNDAVYRKIGAGTEPTPDAVDVNWILTGMHDCRLVELQARVLARVDRGVNQFLLLQSGGLTFQAYLPQRVSALRFDDLQNGSEVIAKGICRIERGDRWQAGHNWRAASFHLLLRSPEDVVVLQSPSTVEMPDGTWVAGGFGSAALAAFIWAMFLRRRLRHQAEMIQRK